jgi:fatty acid desaturase
VNEWQFLAALAVPVIGLTGALFQKERTPGVLRRMKESATALKDLPPESDASKALQALIVTQAGLLQEREQRRVNRPNLILAVILALLAAVVTYFLSVWTIGAWTTPWGWIPMAVSVAVGLFLILLVGAGFSNIYQEPKSQEERGREEAAKAAKKLAARQARANRNMG